MSKHRTTKEGGLPGILPLPGASPDEESTLLFRRYSRQSSTPMKLVIGAVACVALVFIGYLAVSHFSSYQIQTQNQITRTVNGVESVSEVSAEKQQEQQRPPQQQQAPQQAKGNDNEGMDEIIKNVEAEIEAKAKAKKKKYGKYLEYLNQIIDYDPFELSVKQAIPEQNQPTEQAQQTELDEEDISNQYEKLSKDAKKR